MSPAKSSRRHGCMVMSRISTPHVPCTAQVLPGEEHQHNGMLMNGMSKYRELYHMYGTEYGVEHVRKDRI